MLPFRRGDDVTGQRGDTGGHDRAADPQSRRRHRLRDPERAWQTVGDFELIVAGDGCTDRTADEVASFGDPRIRWLDLPKAPGIGYANRNVALRQARGRLIAYLAHDDIWFPDHLERLSQALDEAGAEFAYSRLLSVDLDGCVTPLAFNLQVPTHRDGLWRGDVGITISSVMHTRDCLGKYGYWDEELTRAGDLAMWHRILAGARYSNLVFLSEPTALHFVAAWRSSDADRRRRRLARWVQNALARDVRPGALHLHGNPTERQQETAWREISERPQARVREIRSAAVQFHDRQLWQGHSSVGRAGLQLGLAIGSALDRFWHRLVWMTSPGTRATIATLQRRMREGDGEKPAESTREELEGGR